MEKRGLGRGLAALIADSRSEVEAGQVQEVPIGQVVPNPYQPRTLFDPLKMEELVLSVREHGILQPILLRRVGHERYELVAGERRFRAAQAAGLSAVPALIKDLSEQEQLEMAVVENVQREDIGAMEAARAYRRLMDEFGMIQETVAQRVGKSRASIANTVRLLDLPEIVQESVERGEISEGHARALLMAKEEAAILRAWQIVIKNRNKLLSVRETEKLAREMLSPAPQNASALNTAPSSGKEGQNGRANGEGHLTGTDPNETAAADLLQQALGTKVTIRHASAGVGRIEIEFYSRQDMLRLVDLLLSGREAT